MAFVPVHILPSLTMLLFIAAVGQAAPAVGAAARREAQAAGDALPSRYKGTWPALRAQREARERQEDAEAGVARGSVLASGVVREVQTLVDALPSPRKRRPPKEWDQLGVKRRGGEELRARVMGVPVEGILVGAVKAVGRAVKAGAVSLGRRAGFLNPEEKLRVRRKALALRKYARKAGTPAVVHLAYLSGNVAAAAADAGEAAERDAFWRSPGMQQFQRDLRALEDEFGKSSGTLIFSKDLSTPSKMKAMVMRMKPGWEQV